MTTKNPTTTLPLRLELEYMLMQRRFAQAPGGQLDMPRLRMRLRQIAEGVASQKVAELTELFGKPVRLHSRETINQWVNTEAEAARDYVARLHDAQDGRQDAERNLIDVMRAAIRGQQESRASSALLTLNTELIEEAARGGGSSHYSWRTQMDNRVRDWHKDLQGKTQAWDKPPLGGGTHSGDTGHPGSGYGCRCYPVPIHGTTTTRRPRKPAAPSPPRGRQAASVPDEQMPPSYETSVSRDQYDKSQRSAVAHEDLMLPKDRDRSESEREFMRRLRAPDEFIRPGSTMDEATEAIRHNALEHGAYFDNDGVLLSAHTSAEPAAISMSDAALAKVRSRPGLRFVHNHPGITRTPLSPEDFAVAAHERLAEMRAVTPGGDVFILRPAGLPPNPTEAMLDAAWAKSSVPGVKDGVTKYAIQRRMERMYVRELNRPTGRRVPMSVINARIVGKQMQIAREFGLEIVWQRP